MKVSYSNLLRLITVVCTLLVISCSSAPSKPLIETCSPILSKTSNKICPSTTNKPSVVSPGLIPVLFVPGLGFGDAPACEDFNNWEELHELFKQHGYRLETACIPQNGSIKEVADKLSWEVDRIFPLAQKEKFHIVAKSMGGLATRQMLFEYPMPDRVLSVTTIATPHQGSEIADLLMNGKQCTIRGKILITIYKLFNGSHDGLKNAGKDLSKAQMACFNEVIKRDPSIPFFSFGYKIDCKDPLCKLRKWLQPFYHSSFVLECWHDEIISRGGGENDGLVSEESAQFGTYLGTFEGDHFAETGEPTFFSLMPPLYKGEWIWKDVFEKVIVNLNRQRKDSSVTK